MAMGLVACAPDDLIEIDDRYHAELAERRALLDHRHAEMFATTPGSDAARAELLGSLAALLPSRYPDAFHREGGILRNRLTGEDWNLASPAKDPLEVAGRLVQEDLCLLLPGPAGPILAAAVLCFPSRWALAEKIGRPLAAIHAPVPFYADRLAAPVDRLTRQLRPGRAVMRLNWGVVDDPALFQAKGHGRRTMNAAITAANAGETLFLRVERQTLSQLPATGATLFTIRIHCYPLARIAADRGLAGDLAGAVRALPPEMALYKSVLPFRQALLDHLDRRAS